MAKSSTLFVCSSCGHESAKWHGRCPGCQEWDTLVEESIRPNYTLISSIVGDLLGHSAGEPTMFAR